MKSKHYGLLSLLAIMAMVLLIAIACSSPTPSSQPSTPYTAATQAAPAPTDVWSYLLQRTPYPFTTPLPPPVASVLDGTYAKFDLVEATPIPCRRCPDYFPYHGTWKLSLDNGIFRILHQDTGWRSYASFTVSGDRILFFNDGNCPDSVGVYTWKLEKGALILTVIEDDCAIGLRARNLTSQPWPSCQPPNREAAITGDWPEPPGCQ